MKAKIDALWPPRRMAVVYLVIYFPCSIAAQTVTSTILGTVTDQSGAVVVGTRLTITKPSPFSKGRYSKASINGMRPTWNNLTIDGMDANDPVYNLPPGGASAALPGVEAIREFRVLTQNMGEMPGPSSRQSLNQAATVFMGFEFHRNEDALRMAS